MAKIKVSDVETGQRVRVKSSQGMREGEVTDIKHDKDDDGNPAVWLHVSTGSGGFIDSMQPPDGEIELAD